MRCPHTDGILPVDWNTLVFIILKIRSPDIDATIMYEDYCRIINVLLALSPLNACPHSRNHGKRSSLLLFDIQEWGKSFLAVITIFGIRHKE